MRLSELLAAVDGRAFLVGDATVDISSLAYDSRAVRPGALFFALPGAKCDGRAFAADAVARGAAAVVHTPPILGLGVPEIICEAPRPLMGLVGDAFFAHPSRRLRLYGVTGTNGKTTTTFLLRDLLRAAGRKAGLLGTVQYDVGDGAPAEASRTMPEAPDTHAFLARALENGLGDVAIEVSSQGLAAERAAGLSFAAVGFSHLTGDHLDFHKTMEAYFQAKRRLFVELAPEAPSAVNIRCPYGRRLLGEIASATRRTLSFALDDPKADVLAENLRVDADGSAFDLRTPFGRYADLRLPLPGRYNVENLLLALSLALLTETPLEPMLGALPRLHGAPGRMQAVPDPRGTRRCIVDYAHTDDALRNVLATLRESTKGRLWVVFGCGGDRDATKRPRMGAVAVELADVAIVTSDNPRSENPDAIISDILSGVVQCVADGKARAEVLVQVDRGGAIAQAVANMAPGDTLLVAGKGHETGQLQNGIVTPFDDAEVLARALAR